MASPRRIALSLIVIGGSVLLVSVLLTLVFFNLDRYRPEVISYFEQNTGKKTEIDRLSLTFFPRVTIHIYGLGVKSPPPFPSSDVLKVAQADVVINPWAMLRGTVVIRSLVLKDLAINVMSAPDGHWNFENPQAATSKNTFPLRVIDRVAVERGQLIVSNLLKSGEVAPAFVEGHDITSVLTAVDLAAIVNPTSPSLKGQGTCQVGRLRFGPVETTSVNSKVRLESREVSISDLKANAYLGTITGAFSLDLATANARFTADARMSGIDLAHLLAALQEQRASVTGNLEGDMKLAGEVRHTVSPLAALQGTGHARVTNGEVPSLLSDADMKKLAPYNDQGPGKENPSSFSSISADLRLADLRVSSSVINIEGHGVNVDGSGSVSFSGDLNYRGVVTLTTKQGFWTNTFARFGGASLKDGKLSFPFQVLGTIEKPKFSKASKGG